MTNREKYITKRNEYDMMMTILENGGTYCPIKAISGKYSSDRICRKNLANHETIRKSCGICVQKFLNEQYSGD